MLQWLFGKDKGAARAEDCVWISQAAMRNGIAREIERLAREGSAVLLCVLKPSELDAWCTQLAAHQPERCRDMHKHDALRRQLGHPGSVTVALASGLPKEARDAGTGAVEMLVHGRNDSRTADDALAAFADQIGSRARVTFHLSLDDPLLR